MGSLIEINDTLQLTYEQGFPVSLSLKNHQEAPLEHSTYRGQVFEFTKEDIRIFHTPPTRVFLVQGIDGKWLYWGHVFIIEQSINSETKTTRGKYTIEKLYDPQYQKVVTINEAPLGKSYFVEP